MESISILTQLIYNEVNMVIVDRQSRQTLAEQSHKIARFAPATNTQPEEAFHEHLFAMIGFARRLADDSSFELQLEEAKVFGMLKSDILERPWEVIESKPKINESNYELFEELANQIFRWTCKDCRFLSLSKQKVWAKFFSAFEQLQLFKNSLIELSLIGLAVPKKKWETLAEGDEVSLVQFSNFQPTLDKKIVLNSVFVESKTVDAVIHGHLETMSMDQALPGVVVCPPSLLTKRTESDNDSDASSFFYDHRHGWLQGKVVDSRLDKAKDGTSKKLITINVDTSAPFFINRKKHCEDILRRVGLDPELFLRYDLPSFQVICDSADVYSQIADFLQIESRNFRTITDYQLFLQSKKPNDKFLEFGRYEFKEWKTFMIAKYLNRTFEAIPNGEFMSVFAEEMKRHLSKRSANQAILVIYFVVMLLEPSLFWNNRLELLDLLMHVNRKLRQDELINPSNVCAILSLITLQVFLDRILPPDISKQAFDEVRLATAEDCFKCKSLEVKTAAATFCLFSGLFEVLKTYLENVNDESITKSELALNEYPGSLLISFFPLLSPQIKYSPDDQHSALLLGYLRDCSFSEFRLRSTNFLINLQYEMSNDVDIMSKYSYWILCALSQCVEDLGDWFDNEKSFFWTVVVLKTLIKYQIMARFRSIISATMQRKQIHRKLIQHCWLLMQEVKPIIEQKIKEAKNIREESDSQISGDNDDSGDNGADSEEQSIELDFDGSSRNESADARRVKNEIIDGKAEWAQKKLEKITSIIPVKVFLTGFIQVIVINRWSNSFLDDDSLRKLYDLLFYVSDTANFYEAMRFFLEARECEKQIPIIEHLMVAAISKVKQNDSSKNFLFGIYGDLFVANWSQKVITKIQSETENNNGPHPPQSKCNDYVSSDSPTIFDYLDSFGNEASLQAIYELTLKITTPVPSKVLGSQGFGQFTLEKLFLLTKSFIVPHDLCLMPINDRLSIKAANPMLFESPSPLSKFIQTNNLLDSRNDENQETLEGLMWNKQANELTIFGKRLIREMCYHIAPDGNFNEESLRKLSDELNWVSPKSFKNYEEFIIPFLSVRNNKQGIFNPGIIQKVFLNDFAGNHRKAFIEYIYTEYLFQKNTDLCLPDYFSSTSVFQIKLLATQLSIHTLTSGCQEIQTEIRSPVCKQTNLAYASSMKILSFEADYSQRETSGILFEKTTPQMTIHIKRKKSPHAILFVRLLANN